MDARSGKVLRLGLPKGRMQAAVMALLSDASICVEAGARSYRPTISLPGFETKLLKPQNIVEMLHMGSRDIGFAGADWVRELGAEVVELLDTGFDPVRIVVAAPPGMLDGALAAGRRLVVASEYERIAREWIGSRGLPADFVRSYGATEVFPPEDADVIIDNTATGSTLAANGLAVAEVLMRSTTRLYASRATVADPARRAAVERFAMLLQSVLDARARVMLEVNVPADRLDAVIAILPCMRHPTIARLYGEKAYAVKAAVPRERLAGLVLEIKAAGGTDIVVTAPDQLVR